MVDIDTREDSITPPSIHANSMNAVLYMIGFIDHESTKPFSSGGQFVFLERESMEPSAPGSIEHSIQRSITIPVYIIL